MYMRYSGKHDNMNIEQSFKLLTNNHKYNLFDLQIQYKCFTMVTMATYDVLPVLSRYDTIR